MNLITTISTYISVLVFFHTHGRVRSQRYWWRLFPNWLSCIWLIQFGELFSFFDRSSRIPVLPYIWSAGSWRPVLPGLPFLSYIYSEGSWHNARPSTAAHVAAAQGRSSALRCAGAPEVYGETCHRRRVASCVAPLLCSVVWLKRRGGSGVMGIWLNGEAGVGWRVFGSVANLS